uniref:Uncharacterized protein n=1 Tax=Equus asinus TaxID=9793 RepID=A0A8C4PS88_EQUAS
MEGRKSKRKLVPKRKMMGPLETQFTHRFRNHKKFYDVKMDQVCNTNTGVVSCTLFTPQALNACLRICLSPLLCNAGNKVGLPPSRTLYETNASQSCLLGRKVFSPDEL